MATPTAFRAWQFSSAKGGLEKNLKINPETPFPKRKANQHLVQVLAAGLNPADHKIPELPFVLSFFKTPATPGMDFAGRIVEPADGSTLKPGDLVFGAAGDGGLIGGALGEYAIALDKSVTPIPTGVSPLHAASICVCGVTAYQSIVPYIKPGSSVFINGGSGGTGVFGIQIAKAAGAYVTTTCSTPNVELCKSLGADEVIDYRQADVLQTLIGGGRKYDHVVDNVGSNFDIYFKAHQYTNPGTTVVVVGAQLSFACAWNLISSFIWPGFLGGGKRKISMLLANINSADLAKIGTWMQEGQIKPVIDSQFAFEDLPKAYAKLKTHRAKGKIVVTVSKEVEAD